MQVKALTDVEMEHVVIVAELAFSQRVVVIEIVVERLADQILRTKSDVIFKASCGTHQTV